MEIRSTFIVKNRYCPCACDENGQLLFIKCPECETLLLMCDEIGNVFNNLNSPLDSELPLVIWPSAKQVCPGCTQVRLSNYLPATKQQLIEIGLTEEDFEEGEPHIYEAFKMFSHI